MAHVGRIWMSNLSQTGPPPQSLSASTNLYGIGSPEGLISADPGWRYWDIQNEINWVKNSGTGSTGWVQILAGGGALLTTGSPEGVLIASPPALAYDPDAAILYAKRSGINTNTGWQEILA